MNNKMIGIVLLVIGAGLVFQGYDIYDSAESQVTRAFGGEAPVEAYAWLIGGAVCVVLGILRLK